VVVIGSDSWVVYDRAVGSNASEEGGANNTCKGISDGACNNCCRLAVIVVWIVYMAVN